MNLRQQRRSVSLDKSLWLTLLLLLPGVLVPAGCVLWFMNEASRAEMEAARQSVAEAYSDQLQFIRERVNADWMSRAAIVVRMLGKGSPGELAEITRSGEADGIVLPNPRASAPQNDPATGRSDWQSAQELELQRSFPAAIKAWEQITKSEKDPSLGARAAQAEVRLLRTSGNKNDAVRKIGEYFHGGRLSEGHDLQGGLIAADEQLLEVRLTGSRGAALERLIRNLNDYDSVTMPSGQRLFLMTEVLAIAPETKFPTYQAEHLATQFIEGDGAPPVGTALEASRIPGIWKLRAGQNAIALYREGAVRAAIRRIVGRKKETAAAKFSILAPGEPASAEAVSLGTMLPGWQLELKTPDSAFLQDAGDEKRIAYLWVGYLGVAFIGIAGLLIAGALRRQMRMARLKTDLIAAVSHELRTPLASMRVLVDTLLEEGSPDPVKTREYLELISGENLRLTRLIENFLTFSRIERNRQPLDFREVDSAEIVRTAGRIFRERTSDSNLEFAIEADSGLPMISGDSDAMITVLLNLLDNACKYTPGPKRIRLSAFSEPGGVVFEVKDNGIGIAPREQKRIFRRFYQVDRRLARETRGCGLGLSIVEFLVRAHGGEVQVSSGLGQGSTFTVHIPSVDVPRSAETRTAAA